MNPRTLLDILQVAGRLRDTTRHCYTPKGRHESVAEHSWRISLMAYLIADEFPQADMNKVIKMCLIHDLGECFTGDIPTFDKTDADRVTEEQLLNNWVQTLPEPIRSEWSALFAEMEERKTLEAKINKSMDSLEALISHNESELSTWADHEYDLNMVYGYDKVTFSEYLTALRDEIKADTVKKIEMEK